MKGIEGSDERRSFLDQCIDERRQELRFRWGQLARRAGMRQENLLRIRKNKISISWEAADGIEDALQWERGSIEAAVLHGQRPVATSSRDVPPSKTDPEYIPTGWSEEEEQRWAVARATLSALQLKADLTRQQYRYMRDEYEQLVKVERAIRDVTPGDRS